MLTAPRRGPIALAYRVLVLPGVIAYLFAVSIVVLAADRFWLVDLLTFAWPYVVAAGALLCVVAVITRRLKAIVIAFAGLAIALIPAFDVPTARPSTAASGLKVLTANLYVQNAEDPAVFIDLLRREKPDIVVLQEATPRWVQSLSAAGLFPHESSAEALTRDSLKVFSTLPIRAETELKRAFTEPKAYKQPLRLELDMRGKPLFLYAFHPETPRRLWQWRDRNAYLSAAADAVKGDLQRAPVIVAGDWNTPTWSPFYRGFLRQAGLASTAGGWLQPVTRFSLKLDWLAYIGATIDHVAVSPDISVRGHRVGPAFGSNHLPVIAELAMPET
ncbi:endonuclease/exonuclease/phosphatase family protein [Shinella sp. CPCC 101442]|uniref:endonuclease/exonuclease/phosphatase family protein n=1 Tax=Shinella sp. CPCC 101442 TaxID=2932265 RepID=UPI00215273BB|nr:endonuclease/exonuclease/phosphatase family protein [Shinella sp. CPCC 101442]MCR6498470.1 endonuclease/exonuclease/phosphatase family protein [Shinella sp. CPCC 101442]